MGRAKAAMMEHHENVEWAKGLLARTGAITECEHHGYYTDNLDPGAIEAAEKLAAENPPEGLSAHEAVDLVQEAINEVGEECPGCVARDRD
jgi:hypothetical protein